MFLIYQTISSFNKHCRAYAVLIFFMIAVVFQRLLHKLLPPTIEIKTHTWLGYTDCVNAAMFCQSYAIICFLPVKPIMREA